MQRIAWTIICVLILSPTSALAGEWEKALQDLEMYEGVQARDEEDIGIQEEDASFDDGSELFPAHEDEQEFVNPWDPIEEEFLVIKVDGVPVTLKDVPVKEWYANYVADVAELQIISGYRNSYGRPTGEFGPADAITIEQLAKMAVLTAGLDQYSCGPELKNSQARGRWSENFIMCAEDNGWVVYSEGIVDLTRPALRSEVVVTILQAFGRRISPVTGTLFNDVDRSTTYGNAIETAAGDGIVSGYNDEWGRSTGYFGAKDSVNRAEAAKMFSNAHSVYGD